METVQHPRGNRGRGAMRDGGPGTRRPHSRNRHWVAQENGPRNSNTTTNHVDAERWERGGHRGGRGSRGSTRAMRRFPNVSLHVKHSPRASDADLGVSDTENSGPFIGDSDMEDANGLEEPELETPEEREKFYQELVKARELERKKAIAEGKMDDPLVPKRLEDAITMVGTCLDMCPRFERYRRERENNLFEWETIPGTKRVDHKKAVKMYERAAGDKTLPSDLRPPHVLKKTLDYLFHDLLPRGGFHATHGFIRDRTRAVRNDFTMQHQTGPVAIECHDRCARFHILALHLERVVEDFSVSMEEQQLMNTLQSLKEFYDDQRGRYQSPTELEMRVYHRLIHIRDQKERQEDLPDSLREHPVFKLTTAFRLHVQKKSAPITKTSPLVVDNEGMQIFAQLAGVLREQGNVVMIYLVACILERLFGPDKIEDIEGIRGTLSISNIIDGVQSFGDEDTGMETDMEEYASESVSMPAALASGAGGTSDHIQAVQQPTFTEQYGASPGGTKSAFSNIANSQNVFGTSNIFGGASFGTNQAAPLTSSAFSPVLSGLKPMISMQPAQNASSSTTVGEVQVTTLPDVTIASTTTGDHTSNSESSNPSIFGQSFGSIPVIDHAKLNAAAVPFLPTLSNTSSSLQITPSTSITSKTYSSPLTSADPPAGFVVESPPARPPTRQRQTSFTGTRRLLHLPKINTTIPTAITNTNGSTSLPAQPPPLSKKQPISLPSTPTTAPLQPSGSSGYIKSFMSTYHNSSEILSPLPTGGLGLVHNFSPFPSPTKASTDRVPQRKSSMAVSERQGNGNDKEVQNKPPRPTPEEMEVHALAFEQKSPIVKQCFKRWKQRVITHAAWLAACRQSDSYHKKVQRQARAETAEKKRRISTGSTLESDTTPKKRIRRRISAEYQTPRTDEQLAQRLKENHEEHAHRWARGSFLHIFKSHIHAKNGTLPAPWQIWLSTNPDSDATAIWVERKFDVPNSGFWASENVFSIPISQGRDTLKGSPGLIIFECTPAQNVKDDIERKYHVLDDCARLRDIIKALPSQRHYIPSLLLIRWTDTVKVMDDSDLLNMVWKFVDDSVIGDARIFSLTSDAKNLDASFKEALTNLKLDTTGQLVELLTVRGLFKRFDPILESFASEWMDNSTVDGEFDWTIYAEAARVAIQILNDMMTSLSPLLGLGSPDSLPPLNSSAVDYSDAAYDVAYSWFSQLPEDQFIKDVIWDLQSHQEIGQEFPARIFLNHILDIAIHFMETQVDAQKTNIIMHTDLTAAMDNLKSSIQSHQTTLGHALNNRLRRSPKRRGVSEETEESISFIAKRRRLSSSADPSTLGDAGTVPPSPLLNGRPSPSASVSTMSLAHGDQPRVTVATLRALTKDMKKKYAINGSS